MRKLRRSPHKKSRPPDSEELLQTIQSYIDAGTWAESKRIVEHHPELLSDEADGVLDKIAVQQETEESKDRLECYRALLHRCRQVGSDQAFAEITGAVDVPPEYHTDIRAAQAAEAQYERTGNPAALDDAVAAWERVLQPPGFPTSPGRFQLGALNNAGNVFLARYSAKGALNDLDRALALWREALQAIPAGSPDRSRSLISLSNGLHARYTHMGNRADLEEAIQACREAVQQSQSYSPELPGFLANLGNFLCDRYECIGNAEDLEESIRILESAHRCCSSGSPFLPTILTTLGVSLSARYAYAGQPQDLEAAIEAFQAAVQSTPAGSRELPRYLSNLGNGLNERYFQTGDPADLSAAIRCFQRAVEGTPPTSLDLPAYLTGLGLGLGARYDRTGRAEDLEDAIRAFRQAVQNTPTGSPDLVGYLNNLGAQLRVRYAHTGASQDLEEALQFFRQAIQHAPGDSPDLPGSYTNLGTGLRDLYAVTGQLGDLEEAIEAFQRASQGIPPGSPNLPTYLNDLGVGLSLRYDRSGQLEDLDEYIDAFHRAIASTDVDSPDLPIYLNNLGMGLLERYLHTQSPDDLNGAIQAFQGAVDGTPRKSPDLMGYLNNLGVALHDRFQATGRMEDLQAAIRLYRRVVRRTPAAVPDLSPRLNNLGNGLRDRYIYGGRRRDLEEAIRVYRQAVEHSPPGSTELPKHLNNLAVALRDRYSKTGHATDLQEAVLNFERSATRGLEVGMDEVLRTARNWGDWASERRSWQEAARAYHYGLEAVDGLLRAQLLRPAKEAWLRQAQQYPACIAYALAKAGDGQAAITTLEASRTRLLAEALEQNRRDLEQLPALGHADVHYQYKVAAEHFQSLQARAGLFGQAARPTDEGPVRSLETGRRALESARADLDAAIEAIREVPGYADFYRTPTFEKTQSAVPSRSTLVYLVAAPHGGLALVLPSPDEPSDNQAVEAVEMVWLGTLTDTAVKEIIASYLGAYWHWHSEKSDAATELWHDALEGTTANLGEMLTPLVQHLAARLASTPTSEDRSREPRSVTLVPTGLLGLFPLHAAWWKTNDERRCVLDEFVVAYTPSAQALGFAQLRVLEAERQGHRLLAVVNPTGDLPFTVAEGEALVACFGVDQAQLLENGAATQDALVRALPARNYLHFACHGSYNPVEVLHSGLILARDSPQAQSNPLELAEILAPDFNLSAARLVTLSACETGLTEFQLIPEEAVGLPAGFLQAGAPAVVSSLWAVNDFSTSLLMGEFYRRHLAEGQGIAEALRGAQLWLRDSTAAEMNLANWYERCYEVSGRRDRDAFRAMRYYRANPDDKPFAHPYYWAAFTFSGIGG